MELTSHGESFNSSEFEFDLLVALRSLVILTAVKAVGKHLKRKNKALLSLSLEVTCSWNFVSLLSERSRVAWIGLHILKGERSM